MDLFKDLGCYFLEIQQCILLILKELTNIVLNKIINLIYLKIRQKYTKLNQQNCKNAN